MQKLKSPHEIKEQRLCLEAFETARPCISVCAGSGCNESNSVYVSPTNRLTVFQPLPL